MGSLMLEGANSESWALLGCLSKEFALKQHALIRGLQLDASLSVAWAYLGMVIMVCFFDFWRAGFSYVYFAALQENR